MCRCTHTTQTHHVVHNSRSRYIATHALTQVAMREHATYICARPPCWHHGGAERRSSRSKSKIAVGVRMMGEEGGTARVGARCLTLVSGAFASG